MAIETSVLERLDYANSLTYDGFKAYRRQQAEYLESLRTNAETYERLIADDDNESDKEYLEDARKLVLEEIAITEAVVDRLEYHHKDD